jgi:NAD(P)H-hydrate epimerase
MIPFYREPVPYLSTDQMREVDRLMIEVYHIELIQMMENAGRHLAALARERFLGGNPQYKHVVVLAGTGGNGGGALVCARWLHNAGAQVEVFLAAAPEAFTPVPAHQLDILFQVGVSVTQGNHFTEDGKPDLIIDGLIGYSLKGVPREPIASLIHAANAIDCPTLALDTPSGLDTSTGTVSDPTIRAAATMTLALAKEGLRRETARQVVGELYLANISVPPGLYAQPSLGLYVSNLFGTSDIIRIW